MKRWSILWGESKFVSRKGWGNDDKWIGKQDKYTTFTSFDIDSVRSALLEGYITSNFIIITIVMMVSWSHEKFCGETKDLKNAILEVFTVQSTKSVCTKSLENDTIKLL